MLCFLYKDCPNNLPHETSCSLMKSFTCTKNCWNKWSTEASCLQMNLSCEHGPVKTNGLNGGCCLLMWAWFCGNKWFHQAYGFGTIRFIWSRVHYKQINWERLSFTDETSYLLVYRIQCIPK